MKFNNELPSSTVLQRFYHQQSQLRDKMSDQNQQHRSPPVAAKFQMEQQQQHNHQLQQQQLPQPTNPFFSHIPKYQYSSSPPIAATINRPFHYPPLSDSPPPSAQPISIPNEMDASSIYGSVHGQHPHYLNHHHHHQHNPNSPPVATTNYYDPQNYSTATTTTATSSIPITKQHQSSAAPVLHPNPLQQHYQQNLRHATPPSSPKHQFMYSNRNAAAAASPPNANSYLERAGSLKRPTNTGGRCYEKLPPCKPDVAISTEIVPHVPSGGKAGDLRGDDQGNNSYRVALCDVERYSLASTYNKSFAKCLKNNAKLIFTRNCRI